MPLQNTIIDTEECNLLMVVIGKTVSSWSQNDQSWAKQLKREKLGYKFGYPIPDELFSTKYIIVEYHHHR